MITIVIVCSFWGLWAAIICGFSYISQENVQRLALIGIIVFQFSLSHNDLWQNYISYRNKSVTTGKLTHSSLAILTIPHEYSHPCKFWVEAPLPQSCTSSVPIITPVYLSSIDFINCFYDVLVLVLKSSELRQITSNTKDSFRKLWANLTLFSKARTRENWKQVFEVWMQ